MTSKAIQSIRHKLGENTAQFAARFHRSARTIEAWEQGKRNPDGLALDLLKSLKNGRPK